MKNLTRIDENTLSIENPNSVDVKLFANGNVPIEQVAIDEAVSLTDIQSSINDLDDFFGEIKGNINKISISPDFHKGKGIPIGTTISTTGFIIPKAIGTDINCGVCFVTTDVTIDEFEKLGKSLDDKLRYIFFEGGRDIALDEKQRESILREGIVGLQRTKNNHDKGILKSYKVEIDEFKSHNNSFETCDCFSFDNYVKGSGNISHDTQIGSIGGGNHFVEIQKISEIFDRKTCYNWGVKNNYIGIMAHSGSVGLGATVGNYFEDIAKSIWPSNKLKPVNGFYILPSTGKYSKFIDKYMSAMGNASNFAVVNRLFLILMAAEAFSKTLNRKIKLNFVYDAPHNLVWKNENDFIHRKGTMPSEITEDFPDGHPVLVPGSMGDSSWILKGQGNIHSLCSSAHGAGRIKARGERVKVSDDEIKKLRIITKIDPNRIFRKDVLKEFYNTLKEEAPSCYKDSTPIIETLVNSGTASRVARLEPLMTIKG